MGSNRPGQKSKPRAVLLDAGFTLTFCDGGRIAAVAAGAGVRVTPEALEAAEPLLRHEIASYTWPVTRQQQAASARSGASAFYRRLLELAAATGTPDRLDAAAEAIWVAHLRRNVWCRVGQGVDGALEQLRGAGIRLAVVSNSEGTVAAMLKEVGLARHFETVIDSWVVGYAKPDPRIFHLALERLGIAPHEAIMVGDSPVADIAGAQAAGVDAALLDPLDLHASAEVPRYPDLSAFAAALLGR